MKKHYLKTKQKLNKFENYLKDLNIFKPVLNEKGMELIQVMGIMAIALVLAGALMLAAKGGISDQLSGIGNSIASIYDYVEVSEEDDGSTDVEVNPADKLAIAYDSQRLGGQLPSYYATQGSVEAAQNSADDAMEKAEQADTNASEAQATADEAKEIAQNAADGSIGTYTHSVSGTVHTLTGSGENGKFKAVSAGTISSFAVNGTNYSVRCGEETTLEMVKDGWYTFVLDTGAKTINFRTGGGLSNSKLAEATATEADVLAGKTFYAGDKELKTGTASGYGIAVHVRRGTGGTSTATSKTYHLPAGTYTYDYLSTIYTYPNNNYGCNFKIYVDGTQKVSYSTLPRYSEFLGNLYIFYGNTTGTLTLSEDADVYITISLTISSTYPQLSQGSVYLQRN